MTAISTTQSGAPVTSDAHSKSVGADGAIILTDHYLIEKLAQFNRGRVPERVVHAKGGGAFGSFKTSEDVSKHTKAALFQPGTETDMLIRFSSVAGEAGSPDTWRDPRGFAVKFYTTEGNYDLVGNNTPVFFIRDGIKFPDFIHSQSASPAPTCATPTCSGTSGPSPPSPPTRSPGSWATAACRPPGVKCRATARTPTSGSTSRASGSGSSTTSSPTRA